MLIFCEKRSLKNQIYFATLLNLQRQKHPQHRSHLEDLAVKFTKEVKSKQIL